MRFAIVLFLSIGSIVSSSAAIITFNTANTGVGLSSYTEAGFQFTRISGTQACIESNRFSMGCLSAPQVGDLFQVTRVGGGLFTFTTFESASASGSDGMQFIGRLNTVVTQQLLSVPSPQTGISNFSQFSTGFTAPIDLLEMSITSVGSDYFRLDNLELTVVDNVPEPSTLGLVGLTIFAAGCFRRRK